MRFRMRRTATLDEGRGFVAATVTTPARSAPVGVLPAPRPHAR